MMAAGGRRSCNKGGKIDDSIGTVFVLGFGVSTPWNLERLDGAVGLFFSAVTTT